MLCVVMLAQKLTVLIGVHNAQGSTVHFYILESDAIATMLSPQALKVDKL